jgi:anti-sigma factor RsiW
MIPYIGCETAREMLEAFVDGELPMADQVAVESHLRWCRTCTARVEDVRLIATSLRGGSRLPAVEDVRALTAMQAAVLTRVRAEREQSLPVRVRAMFDDMRFFWPAVGASAALAASLLVLISVLQAATAENPESLAAMIERLERAPAPVLPPANPGSNANPLRLDGRLHAPRVLEGTVALDALTEDEVSYALSAVVTRQGRIATYDLLQAEHATGRPSSHGPEDVSAVLDVVKRSRFAPAEAAGGRKVAVNMVWLLVRTTAKADVRRPAPRISEDVVVKPEVEEPPAEPSTDAQDVPSTTA